MRQILSEARLSSHLREGDAVCKSVVTSDTGVPLPAQKAQKLSYCCCCPSHIATALGCHPSVANGIEEMSNRRVTHTKASKSLMCLEVIEQGLLSDFRLCSGCDYYKNNIALNGLAQKKPCSQLSKYWQCTTPHNNGSLTQAKDTLTPYQPVKLTKYNSLFVAEKNSCSVQSGNKRVRLFSPASGESSGSIPQHSGFDRGGSDRNALFASRSIAVIECNVANAAQANMSKEHGRILCEYNTVAGELEGVKLELAAAVSNCDLCLAERDRLLSERDIACEKYDKAVAELSYISGQLDTVLMKRNEAVTQ